MFSAFIWLCPRLILNPFLPIEHVHILALQNHNQNRKAHRNGIKKPQTHKYASTKGVSSPFLVHAKLWILIHKN